MPQRSDFSGGFNSRPLELHQDNQVVEASGCYWAGGLRKWGGTVARGTIPGTPIGSTDYKTLGGRPVLLVVSVVTESQVTGARVYAFHADDNTVEGVAGNLFWVGVGTDEPVRFAHSEQGLVMIVDGQWPMVLVDDGAFEVRTLDSFDVRERDPHDFDVGYTLNVRPGSTALNAELPDGTTLAHTFKAPDSPGDTYGELGDSITFENFEDNVIWCSSILTFNHFVVKGSSLVDNVDLYVVLKDGSYELIPSRVAVNAAGTEMTVECDWQARFAEGNLAPDIKDFSEGEHGQGDYRAFLHFKKTVAIPRPGQPQVTGTPANNAARISWGEVRHAVSYEWRRKTTSSNSWTGWANVGTALFVDVGSLTNRTSYDFEVRARNSSGAGVAGSTTLIPTSDVQPPGVPSLRYDGYTIIPVRAVAGGAPDNYDIEFREGLQGGFTRRNRVTGNITTTINGQVYGRIRARNAAGATAADGESPWSGFFLRVARPENVVATPVVQFTPPGVPSLRFDGYDIIVTAGAGGDPADSFTVRYREGSNGSYTTVTGVVGRTTITLNGVVEAQVQAVNAGGNSAWSDTFTRPSRPTNLLQRRVANRRDFIFALPSDATSFRYVYQLVIGSSIPATPVPWNGGSASRTWGTAGVSVDIGIPSGRYLRVWVQTRSANGTSPVGTEGTGPP